MAIDFRIRDFCYPIAIWRLKRFLDRSQWLDRHILTDYQEERLRTLVNHAYNNVPYYRNLFNSLRLRPSDIRKLEDLRKLPILTKSTVRAHFKELVATNAWRFFPRLYRTSGSTGPPLDIYHDRSSNVLEFATYWWHWGWAGYRLGDKFLSIRHRPFVRAGRKRRLWHFDYRLRCLYLSPLKFNPEEVELYAERIRRFKPKFLKTRPVRLYLLAKGLKEKGITDLHLNGIFTGGHNLLERDVRLAEEVFHCRVYDHYGLMERVADIRQCEFGTYHVNQVYGIVEVLDEKGEPVSEGQRGKIIATGLHNLAMPLIRYETMDHGARGLAVTCPCRRTLPQVYSIYGFVEDPVITPDGRHLVGLDSVFNVAWGIKMGQIVQTKRDRIEVRVVKDSSYKEEDRKAILEALRVRTGDGMELEFALVDHIEPTEQGKFKWVRSEIM